MNIANSSKLAQCKAAEHRAAVATVVAYAETQAIALRDTVAKPSVAYVRANAPVVARRAVLATKCGTAFVVSYLRTLAGK